MTQPAAFLERRFRLRESGTNVRTEIGAGLTTFMTMAYILAVNPGILSACGMDAPAVFTATALSSAVAGIIMAFAANLPIGLAPGMGINAFSPTPWFWAWVIPGSSRLRPCSSKGLFSSP